jgi:hypothetical protein
MVFCLDATLRPELRDRADFELKITIWAVNRIVSPWPGLAEMARRFVTATQIALMHLLPTFARR